MNTFKVASKYLKRQALDFEIRMNLVKEFQELGSRLEHLEKRLKIDKLSDVPEAREVKEEIKRIKTRSQEILTRLMP